MRSVLLMLVCQMLLLCGGCANFRHVGDFADQTAALAQEVGQEIRQVDRLCTEQAELRIVLTNAPDDGLLAGCRVQADAAVAFQQLTAGTLDLYAATLKAMIDDNRFALSGAIENTGQKLAALQTRDGQALLPPEKVGALSKLIGLLADVVVQAQREQGIRRLVAAGPDLVANGRVLREFFAGRGSSSPHARWVQFVQDQAEASAALIAPGTALARQEPIRSAELRRTIARAQPALAGRRQATAEALVAQLDDWIAAVPVFQQEALQPDPRALQERIKTLRQRSIAVRDAVRAGF